MLRVEQVADRYAAAGQPWLAALAYGDARYPCLANEPKKVALQRQIEQYTLASKDFPVTFDRRVVTTRFNGEVVEVPVHPGTGELTYIPMTPDSIEIVDGLITFARTLTTGKVGHLGVSFGGYFAAHSSLTEVVAAAVVIGGPVTTASFSREHLAKLMYGMEGIVGNPFGFTSIPTSDQVLARAQAMAMDDLVAKGTNCPTLAINGDNDVHVPLADVQIWQDRPDTDVELIAGGTHCAMNKLDQLMPIVTSWLTAALH